MKGLLIKDYFSLKNTLKVNLTMMVLFILIGTFTKNMMYILMMITMMSMNTITNMSYDQASNWNQYSLTMPIRRRDLVRSKYIYFLINSIVSVIVSMILVFILIYSRSDLALMDIFLSHYSVFVSMLIANSVLIPIVFKFGVEKASVSIFGLVVFGAALVGIMTFFIDPSNLDAMEAFIKRIVFISPFVAGLILFTSLKLSEKIVEEKDF